jgi:hypothetical protein
MVRSSYAESHICQNRAADMGHPALGSLCVADSATSVQRQQGNFRANNRRSFDSRPEFLAAAKTAATNSDRSIRMTSHFYTEIHRQLRVQRIH